MRPAFALAVVFALACDSPSYESGHLQCAESEPRCPSGFHCASDDTCWRNGEDPDLGTGDLGMVDLQVLLDFATDDACAFPACECGILVTPCGQEIDCGNCVAKAQICGAVDPNVCGCPPSGRLGVYRAVSADGLRHCFTVTGDECPGFTIEGNTPKFYAYQGDPPTGTVPLLTCFDGTLYTATESASCPNGGQVLGTLGYVPETQVCGTVPLHRYDTGANGEFATTDPREAPVSAAEILPSFYVWISP